VADSTRTRGRLDSAADCAYHPFDPTTPHGGIVARKTVLVCDNCGKEVGEGKGAVMRMSYSDARRGAKQADLCDDCAGKMPGHAVARRGRRPKSAVAA
jgi:hypothetical protein